MRKGIYRLGAQIVLLVALVLLTVGCSNDQQEDKNSIAFDIPQGFELETVYTPTASQGSWVSITEADDQLYYACDQYGSIYSFMMPGVGEELDSSQVVPVPLNIGYAQGLLWAFNSLYVVVVNRHDEDNPEDPSSGVYRLKDTNSDGVLDSRKKILDLDGDGEHGPHTMRVSPDGQSVYLIAGNFNSVPDHFKSRLPRTWGEDNLLPPYLDARGHAVDLKAPGGWIAKADPDGAEWELVAAGMRNPFSLGFNSEGDLFAYDADMEWDFGMPWYRPTRILHITSGAEFGWRTGSGKWPATYPDNLPSVVDMAQGSPTAVIMGKDLSFPTRYRNGLFACDWSFGTIYYVDLQPEGSSYTATKSEFLSGVPLPISNAVAGSDGHLYFMTGGRRLKSHLFRLRYVGEESVALAANDLIDEIKELREIRNTLEGLHYRGAIDAVALAWPYLNHDDQHIRYAARIAIEHQPLNTWQDRLWNASDITTVLEGALGYARSGGILNNRILNKLNSINWTSIDTDHQNTLLRVYGLLLIRNPNANDSYKKSIADHLSSRFPSNNLALDRQLSQLLIYCGDHNAVAESVKLLESESLKNTLEEGDILSKELLKRSEMYGPQIADMIDNMPPTEAIHYATVLSHAQEGWTSELRTKYFEWFYNALSKKGGMSYKGYLDNIRTEAMTHVPEAERAYYQEMSGFYSPMKEMAALPQPIGPGKDYNLYDIGVVILWGLENKVKNYKGTFADGERAFQAALCSTCHRMKGEGGASGPDLTNINTRFSPGDISNAILSPSEEISDQYSFTLFNLKDDKRVTGRIVNETETAFQIFQSPYDMTQLTEVSKSDVVSKEESPLSPMPANLLNRLNEDEVRDLYIYLLAGGDADHEYYQ